MNETTDLERIRKYISSVKWSFAKTMPKHPHSYTLAKWCPEQYEDFKYFAHYIRSHGYQGNFYKITLMYLDLDEFTYWTMGCPIKDSLDCIDPVNDTILINRAEIKEVEL